jgi:hypothetical protein
VHHINWGDVPTWLAVIVATFGGWVALRQLRQQGNVLKDEIERNKARDELLDRQLRELQQRAEVEERRQAEDIDFTQDSRVTSIRPTDPGAKWPYVHMAIIVNESRRPIRDVVCRIQPNSVQDYDWEASRIVDLTVPGDPVNVEGARVGVVRVGRRLGFVFEQFEIESHPDASVKVQFTDDAGRHWQINKDMHLEKLTAHDW